MKTIEAALAAVDGYLISIARDTVNGWYEIEVGLPPNWVFDENDKIGCEVLIDEEEGKLVKITPKKPDVVIDDLIGFLEIIKITNEKITEKEKQFTESLEEKKRELEIFAKGFYDDLDELKENSFQKLNASFAMNLNKPKKPRKPRTPKPKTPVVAETPEVVETPAVEKKDELLELDESQTTSNPTNARTTTVTEETTVIEQPKE